MGFGSLGTEYSPALMDGSLLPIQPLFAHVSKHLAEYAHIYPSLLSLLVNHFPELFLPENTLELQACPQPLLRQAPIQPGSRELLKDLETLCEQAIESPTAVCFGMASSDYHRLRVACSRSPPLIVIDC